MSRQEMKKFHVKSDMNGELLTNDSNLREWMNTFREGKGLQTVSFARWSWMHKYTASKRWLGKSQKRTFVKETFWHRTNWDEMFIQEALPSFLSSNPHSSCSVTWYKTVRKKQKNKHKTETVYQVYLLNNYCGKPRVQYMQLLSKAALTYWRHSTDAESWSRGREAELVQYCVGPCWINHYNVAVAGGARDHPHITLTQKKRHGETWSTERPVAWNDKFSRNDRQQCVITRGEITDSLCSRRRSQVGLQ